MCAALVITNHGGYNQFHRNLTKIAKNPSRRHHHCEAQPSWHELRYQASSSNILRCQMNSIKLLKTRQSDCTCLEASVGENPVKVSGMFSEEGETSVRTRALRSFG